MIRVFEILLSLLMVLLLFVVVAALLPGQGHVERSVEVSSPIRQVFDSLDTFRRFPQWSSIQRADPQARINYEGPESGPGARVTWISSAPKIGDGSLEIVSTEQDRQIKMAVNNGWNGQDKMYTIDLIPSSNGKTVKIKWSYDVDYDWNLIWRFAGLYINGDPDTQVQSNLAQISSMLATFPNVDYSDTEINLVDVPAKPVLLVSTRAKRTLDDVAEATDKAMGEIEAEMTKLGLTAAGPRMTITTNWGDEDYVFDIAVPVNAATFTVDNRTYTIEPASKNEPATTNDDDLDAEPTPKVLGDYDNNGYLVVEGPVRAVQWYGGKALMTEYTGSPASLPLLRLYERAYAETHGYPYSEMGDGRSWDELTSAPDAPADEESFKVYLPVQLSVDH